MQFTRREFALGAAAATRALSQPPRPAPTICLLSASLPKFHYSELGGVLRDLGFAGCDLTVRPGGHVEPALSAADMYRAVEAIRGEGVDVPMITTTFISAGDRTAPNVLGLSGRMKVPYFTLGDWPYLPGGNLDARLAEVRRDVTGLVALGRACGMAACFHNRAGGYAGAAIWDVRGIIDDTDPQWLGYCFDPSEATAAAGDRGWEIAMRVALPRIKIVAVQDFYWAKRGSQWAAQYCPLGEGMVDWPRALSLLASARFAGPLSLRVEHATPGDLSAISRDLEFLKKHVAAAFPIT